MAAHSGFFYFKCNIKLHHICYIYIIYLIINMLCFGTYIVITVWRTEEIMKKLMKKFEDIMVAVTFAESGEYDEALANQENAYCDETEKSLAGFKRNILESAQK